MQSEVAYTCIGEPTNCIEQIVKSELGWDDELSYLWKKNNYPEDLNEHTTDWYDMKQHADGLSMFIDRVKQEYMEGIIDLKR